jgi:hypothetical protein
MFHATEHIMPSSSARFFLFRATSFHRDASARFIAGTALISVSFLVYLAYPIILLMLPLGKTVKLAAVVAVWILSWGAFSAGIFLAGPDAFQWFKDMWPHLKAGRIAKKQDNRALPE